MINEPTVISPCGSSALLSSGYDLCKHTVVATLGAAKDKDWFHEASKGWCYTESSLRDIFDLSPDCTSNYDKHDQLFEVLVKCDLLRDNLADFYFKSGNNGMPWGVWDPRYQPVGIVKSKK